MFEKKIQSFRYSFRGLKTAWVEEFNFRLQILIGVIALFLGWYFRISVSEWVAVILVIGLVLSAEVFNTALEELCDKFKSDPDPHIAKIKNLAAAAVLIASAAALIVGIIIFLPHLV